MSWLLPIAAGLAPEMQKYLTQARQMQALSFAAHIPLVCFGIALPTLLLSVEWLYLRTGDELYRTLAWRWTRVMTALFAAGVVTGTILSFEMGLLWPNFTGTFGGVFGRSYGLCSRTWLLRSGCPFQPISNEPLSSSRLKRITRFC
jgi:cytochrome bd ubiquinol oxidase subunit I